MGKPEKQTQYEVLFHWPHYRLQMAANKAKNHNMQEIQCEKHNMCRYFTGPIIVHDRMKSREGSCLHANEL